MIKKTILSLFTIATVFILVACSSDDSDDSGNMGNDGFDRSAMLSNWADNIIIPRYENLNVELNAMVEAKNNFNADPSSTNFEALRASFRDTYKAWQYVEMFNVGMAESTNYIFQMNVFPTNTVDIQQNIDNQNYDLSSVNNNDAVGFPALDYMIYGLAETDAEILAFYSSSSDAENYKGYLSDLVDRMQVLTETIVEDWNNGYRDSFVDNTDNSATGSINLVVNDFIFYYEKGFRANKFGIPAGNFSQNPLPDRVEAYYSPDLSRTLAQEAMRSIQTFFNGVNFESGTDGVGLTDYLNFLNTIKESDDLSSLINNQLNEAETKIATLNESLAEQVETNNVAMTETFDTIQEAVILLKVDMLQALDIRVDFVDADGD
jgi:predicted lipoprotein